MARFGRVPGRAADVLVVCTGNICRSPYLAARLAAAVPTLTVASAGTGAVIGAPATPEVLAALHARGVDATSHRGRRLTARGIESARLIVTAERAHRIEVIRLVPSASGRTVTAIELAGLLAAEPASGGVDGILERIRTAVPSEADTDLADPYGLDQDAYDEMTRAADAVLDVLIPALGETSPRRPADPRR